MKYALALGALIGLVAAAPANATAIGPASATGPVTLTYNVTLDEGISGVSNILVIEQFGDGSYSYSYGPSLALGSGSSSFSLALSSPTPQNPLTGTLGLGLTGGNHLVVLGNFAPAQIGLSYASLFPDAIEESEILIDLNSIFVKGSPNENLAGFAFQQDELGLVNDAASIGLFTAPGSAVDAVSFSDGQLIGTGTLTATSPVPEPLTLSLFGAGVAGAFAMRRSRTSSASAKGFKGPLHGR